MQAQLTVALAILAAASGALIKSQIKGGECVCATTVVNARSAPGLKGSVTSSMSTGSCGKINGGILTTDGYTWYQLQYGGKIVWVAGNYLKMGSSSDCSSACGAAKKNLACTLLSRANGGNLDLAKSHPSGNRDNGYAYNNIRDMCNGQKATRSSYYCSICPSGIPGGTVCLTNNLLNYLKVLSDRGRVIVNELAGACHSCTSRHYNGQAVDLHNDGRSTEYMNTCTSMNGWALDEGNHIHCQFYD